jgi:ceramide glucosyltransferase
MAAAASRTPLALVSLVALLLLRALALVHLQRSIYGRALHAPVSSLLSELLQPLHLLHALLWRRIVWRTRRYRVRDDRHFEEIR